MQLVVHFRVENSAAELCSIGVFCWLNERRTWSGIEINEIFVRYSKLAKLRDELFDNLWKMIDTYVLSVYRGFDLKTRLVVHAWARRVYLSPTIARIYLNSL